MSDSSFHCAKAAGMPPADRRTWFLHLARSSGAFRGRNGECTMTILRRFIACFGCSPEACSMIWDCLKFQGRLPPKAAPVHLFWMLFFLKVYPTESVAADRFGCDEKTYREWVWTMMRAVANLDMVRSRSHPPSWSAAASRHSSLIAILNPIGIQIRWENRYMNDNGSVCLVTVDGTDCPINEPSPFSPRWYSHKMNGPGVRYEVGVCIQTSWIVWVSGPYPCGAWSDYRISRESLVWHLAQGEKFLADGGYRDGGLYAETPTGANKEDQRMKQVARARHETVNSLLKRWNVLRTAFRSQPVKHSTVFHAIANITQLQIESGECRLFAVLYDDAVWRLVP